MLLWWDNDRRQIFTHTHTHTCVLLHFADNSQTSDEGEEYDQLCKLRTVSDKLYVKFYYHSEHLAMDKVFLNSGAALLSESILQWKGNVPTSEITNYVTNQGIRVTWECTWGKDSNSTVGSVTATHVWDIDLQSWRLRAQNIYMGEFFRYQDLLRDMWSKFMWCNLGHQKRHAPLTLDPKKLKLKGCDIKVKIRGRLTALVWKDIWEVYMLTCNRRKFFWPQQLYSWPSLQWYDWHICYVSNSDHMANSYYMSQLTLKWTPKLFFHFMDLTVLTSWILLSSCGAHTLRQDSDLSWCGMW